MWIKIRGDRAGEGDRWRGWGGGDKWGGGRWGQGEMGGGKDGGRDETEGVWGVGG